MPFRWIFRDILPSQILAQLHRHRSAGPIPVARHTSPAPPAAILASRRRHRPASITPVWDTGPALPWLSRLLLGTARDRPAWAGQIAHKVGSRPAGAKPGAHGGKALQPGNARQPGAVTRTCRVRRGLCTRVLHDLQQARTGIGLTARWPYLHQAPEHNSYAEHRVLSCLTARRVAKPASKREPSPISDLRELSRTGIPRSGRPPAGPAQRRLKCLSYQSLGRKAGMCSGPKWAGCRIGSLRPEGRPSARVKPAGVVRRLHGVRPSRRAGTVEGIPPGGAACLPGARREEEAQAFPDLAGAVQGGLPVLASVRIPVSAGATAAWRLAAAVRRDSGNMCRCT